MKEYMDFDTACTEINRGFYTVDDIDWEFMLVQIAFSSKYMGETENLIKIQTMLTPLFQYETRIDVLKHIIDAARENEPNWGIEYECLIPFYKKLQTLKNKGVIKSKRWNTAFVVCDECAMFMKEGSPEELVAYSQSLIESKNNPTSSNPTWYQITRIYQFIDKLYTKDICEFLGYLYSAANYQQYLASEYEKYADMPTTFSFPVTLRNACFDIYIRLRAQQIKKDILQEETLLKVPTPEELLQILVNEELENVQMYTEKHNGKIVEYSFLEIPTEYLLKWANLFIEYLQDMIANHRPIPTKHEPKKLLPRMPYCTYIVPNAPKTRDEIEADIVRASKKSAQTFANLLTRYREKGYLDFRGESPHEVYEYMKERYLFDYTEGNFSRYFKG